LIADRATERFETSAMVSVGSYRCRSCGMSLTFDCADHLTRCPGCGGTSFRRARLFAQPQSVDQPTLERPAIPAASEPPEWLPAARAELPRWGQYLAFRDDDDDEGDVQVVPLRVGWSRIGRSARADIRLDDPTVSRRHALVVRTRDGEIRVLDDRSLNGVRVNGKQVEWGSLADGDELAIGRFRFYLVDREPTGSEAPERSTSAN
jgi:DNA-directed RNA polymerase subunit RPC12/RpoP